MNNKTTYASNEIGLHLLDVRVRPCAYVKEVIEGSWKYLHDGAEKGAGRSLYGFKELNKAYGDQTKLTCTPLRSFEGFAERVLGSDADVAGLSFKRVVGNTGDRLHWLVFYINYRGRTIVDLLKIWLQEANSMFLFRNKGDMQVDMFKVVGEREVHSFWRVADAELLDDVVFTLPIMKELGDQVSITTKTIVCL